MTRSAHCSPTSPTSLHAWQLSERGASAFARQLSEGQPLSDDPPRKHSSSTGTPSTLSKKRELETDDTAEVDQKKRKTDANGVGGGPTDGTSKEAGSESVLDGVKPEAAASAAHASPKSAKTATSVGPQFSIESASSNAPQPATSAAVQASIDSAMDTTSLPLQPPQPPQQASAPRPKRRPWGRRSSTEPGSPPGGCSTATMLPASAPASLTAAVFPGEKPGDTPVKSITPTDSAASTVPVAGTPNVPGLPKESVESANSVNQVAASIGTIKKVCRVHVMM